MKGIYEDLTGWHQPNGRWTVIERGPDGIDKHGNKYVQWWCQCDCHGDQSKKLLRTHTITSEESKSCGCWNREIHKDVMKKNKRYNKLTEEEIKAKVEAKGNQFISAEYILKGGKYRWQICILCKECNKPYTTMWDSYKNKPGTCPECSINNSHREQRLKKANENNLVEAYPNILNLWDYDKNEDIPENYSCRSNYNAHYNCNICGHPWHGRINTIYMKSWSRGLTGCAACAGQIATPETCIAATHPHLVQYFVNQEDAYKYKKYSNQHSDLRCPLCGTIKEHVDIPGFVERGFNCPSCGTKTSFPERFMYNLLESLNVNFKFHYVFDWSKHIYNNTKGSNGNKEYDFWLLDYNLIIETHGDQHYSAKRGKFKNKTLKEEQENDLLKYNLAIANDKRYVIIDCRKAEYEYIKNNILQSELSNIFDLTNVDWLDVLSKSHCDSYVKRAADLWNSGLYVSQISEQLHRVDHTTRKYLRTAVKLNWCNYNSKENLERMNTRHGINFEKPVYCFELNKEFPSISIAKRETGAKHIGSCCRKERTYSGRHPITSEKLHWCFADEKETYQIRKKKTVAKKIYCFGTKRYYKSATAAGLEHNILPGNISYAIKHGTLCNGWHWCLAENVNTFVPNRDKSFSPVLCVDTMTIYDSMKTMEMKTGICKTGVSSVCRGLQKTAGGYDWKYVYDKTFQNKPTIPGAITLGLITEEQALAQLNTQQND